MARARPKQQELVFRTWGGKRDGAGRKRTRARPGVPHRARPSLSGREPVHVTWRMKPHIWNLRAGRCFRPILRAFQSACDRNEIRLTHYAVSGNHIHMIVEPASAHALTRALQGLGVRLARGINKVIGRKGRIFDDRYHVEVLETPSQVQRAVAYVLNNFRIHAERLGKKTEPSWIDPLAAGPCPERREHEDGRGVAPPRTWLLRVGLYMPPHPRRARRR